VAKKKNGSSSSVATGGGSSFKLRTTVSDVTFKVVGEDGKERRMTAREKKAAKNRANKLKKKRQLEEHQSTVEGNDDFKDSHASQQQILEEEQLVNIAENRKEDDDDDDDLGDSWSANTQESSIREEELEDLQFDRKGSHAVPAVISSALAAQALRIGLLQVPSTHSYESEVMKPVKCDDGLAEQWAIKIKEGMVRAEELRAKEANMRPMAYRIVPEVWSRLRPVEGASNTKQTFLTESKESETVSSKEDEGTKWSFTCMNSNMNDEINARQMFQCW